MDGFGRLGGRGQIIRIDVCRVFIIWPREKSGTPPKSCFEFLTLENRNRFFFFVSETLNHIFLENPKRRAPKNDRDVSSKVNLEPNDAIWCQFGSQFSSPKRRIRVRVSSFRTAGTVPKIIYHCFFTKYSLRRSTMLYKMK